MSKSRARQANRRQTRALIEHTGDNLPERQLALPIGAQGGDEAEFARQLSAFADSDDAVVRQFVRGDLTGPL